MKKIRVSRVPENESPAEYRERFMAASYETAAIWRFAGIVNGFRTTVLS
jgi:hypothetical protein